MELLDILKSLGISDCLDTRDGWRSILPFLPPGWKEKMRSLKAFTRGREIKTEEDLLRLLLGFAVLKKHLEGLAAWAEEQGIASMSFVAVWKRIAKSKVFLLWLVNEMLAVKVERSQSSLVFGVLDATAFSLPASVRRDYLVHMTWSAGRILDVRLTKARGKGTGESFQNINELPPDVVVIADRAYGTPPGVAKMVGEGRRFISRFTWNNLPLYNDREDDKVRMTPQSKLESLAPGECVDFPAWVRAKGKDPVEVRIVAVRMTKEQAEKAVNRSRKDSMRKNHEPDPTTGFAAQFVLLVTMLPSCLATAREIADAYRWRWQLELEFKRMKGAIEIRKLVNWKDDLVRCYLLTMMAVWILAHNIAERGSFFPWGCPLVQGR